MMPRLRVGLLLRLMVIAALCVSAGCDRPAPPIPKDSSVARTLPRDSAAPIPPAAQSPWDVTAGPMFVVAGATPPEGIVVYPLYLPDVSLDTLQFDVAGLQSADVELFARGRTIGAGKLTATAPPKSEGACPEWPSARVFLPGGAPASGWTTAFARGRAEAIAMDSIEGMSRADSARIVADVARLASGLPNDTATTFRGLPFTVLSLRRFYAESGIQTIVADVVRKVNEEANPREEQLLVVAERDSGVVGAPLEAAYTERVSGPEEMLEGLDLLTAVKLGDARRPSLLFAHEYGDGVFFTLIERVGRAKWQHRWKSAYSGC